MAEKNRGKREHMSERLEQISKRLKSHRIYYSKYNPRSDVLYDVTDANEDVSWLVYEVERLADENSRLREMVEYFKGDLSRDLQRGRRVDPAEPPEGPDHSS